jgi:hypothetical protein
MSNEFLKKRPRCEEGEHYAFGKCQRAAKFVLRSPTSIHLVCGIHARIYQSKALNPFRIRELPEIRLEQGYKDTAKEQTKFMKAVYKT